MTIVIIPSFSCNFRCRYCYLNNSTKQLSDSLSAKFVCSVLNQVKETLCNRRGKLSLIWHGGEPLLWGIDNYKQVFEFIKSKFGELEINNSIQCNLSLINDEYIELFKQHNIKVGFSMDGPKDTNDLQRVFANGIGTFDVIMEKLDLCRSRGLNVGCVTVCSRKFIGKINLFYQFMNDLQLGFKLNPLFVTGEATNVRDEFGITAMEYANIMIELFDLMLYDTYGQIEEDNLIEIASAVATGVTEHCLFGSNCQDQFLAIAPTGDVMPCGRFCDNDLLQYSYGNLHNEPLTDILPRIKQSEAYKRAEYITQSGCAQCKWYHICHGGCLHDGFLASSDFRHKTFLCPAYKRIFAHIEQRLKEQGMIK